jgi:hypothetical protein
MKYYRSDNRARVVAAGSGFSLRAVECEPGRADYVIVRGSEVAPEGFDTLVYESALSLWRVYRREGGEKWGITKSLR